MDFLRAASILAVVFGHWLIAAVVRRHGEVTTRNALASIGSLRPATWVVQIIAVFFVVGGFSNLRSLERAGPGGSRDFLARRAERLLRPTIVFVAVWLALAVLLDALPVDDHLLYEVARIAAQPLWFLAVYLLVVLCAPLQVRVHRRWPWLLLSMLPIVTIVLDVLRLSELAEEPAIANYLVVFLVAQELGFHYAEGRFERVRPLVALACGAAATCVLVALTAFGPYPVSMVGLPGERISNMSPPTSCMLVLTVAQGCVLLALRPRLSRWLAKPGPWRATIVVNLVIMTLFLWHLSAFVVVGALAVALDALPAIGTVAWWVQKPLWLAGSSAVLVLLVALFSPIERMRTWTSHAARTRWRPIAGVLLAARGLAGFALSGFTDAMTASGRPLLGTRCSPVVDLALLFAGWLLACDPRLRRGQRGDARRAGPAHLGGPAGPLEQSDQSG